MFNSSWIFLFYFQTSGTSTFRPWSGTGRAPTGTKGIKVIYSVYCLLLLLLLSICCTMSIVQGNLLLLLSTCCLMSIFSRWSTASIFCLLFKVIYWVPGWLRTQTSWPPRRTPWRCPTRTPRRSRWRRLGGRATTGKACLFIFGKSAKLWRSLYWFNL